jgi:hypothetical protein
MSHKILVGSLLVGAVALACTDGTGPSLDGEAPNAAAVPDGALHHVQWAVSEAPQRFTAVGAVREAEILLAVSSDLSAESAGSRLETYKVAFWAVRGEDRYVQINQVQEIYGRTLTSPYLRFDVPAKSLDAGPDGRDYEYGDSVLITITVDPTEMVAHYEPSGLRFEEDAPAVLQVWYDGANGDFDGDGDVDKYDAYIEARLLGIWMQQSPGYPWYRLPAEHSLSERWFRAQLRHFSGYAVSWQE